MGTIWIDGSTFEVDSSRNLLDVSLNLGFDLPYFCWHPAMGSVGACRQCAVKQFKDEDDDSGKLVMACMEPAKDGARISIQDPEAQAFRKSVAEWLMVNHPHDCPICDEGGECHLQDMTVMAGHTYRRYRFTKRTFRNQDLGPLINHEMNRCIQCYRCVRFYNDYAGGRDLQAFAAHDHVYFGRHQDGPFENPFSGNLVEVCPTGVFTDKTLKRHYTRKWDLQTAPSVCVHCSLGCNTTPGERYGTLRRVRARYNNHINGYFLCDRGRYGYEFVNHERRIHHSLEPRGVNQSARQLSRADARQRFRQILAEARGTIGIGSARASLESNFALRHLVGPARFYHGVSRAQHGLVEKALDILRTGPTRTPSLDDIRTADAVLVLGEDIGNTAPMLSLAVRQAARQQPLAIADGLGIPRWHDAAVREAMQERRGPVFVLMPSATNLDDIARKAFRAAPEDLARLGFAVAHAIDSTAPAVPDLPPDVRQLAGEIAVALRDADRPVVVAGTGAASAALLEAAANIAWALTAVRGDHQQSPGLSIVVPECNQLGLALMQGESLDDAARAVADGAADTVIVLEVDLYRHAPKAMVDALFDKSKHVVVLDHIAHDTAARADLVLPAATFAEGDGTLVNNEGRAQRYYQVFSPSGDTVEAWRWLCEAADAPWRDVDELTGKLAHEIPIMQDLPALMPLADARISKSPIPRQPHRYSGRTAMHANRSVHEPRPAADPDSPYAFSMEGYEGDIPGHLMSSFWAPGWNSIQSLNKFQIEIGGGLREARPGLRLIEPDSAGRWSYFADIPSSFRAGEGRWRVLRLAHVFGSEELSAMAPGIASLAPEPYAALHPDDATSLADPVPNSVDVALDGTVHRLPLRVRSDLPRNTVAIPDGLVGYMGDASHARWAAVQAPGGP